MFWNDVPIAPPEIEYTTIVPSDSSNQSSADWEVVRAVHGQLKHKIGHFILFRTLSRVKNGVKIKMHCEHFCDNKNTIGNMTVKNR